MSEIQISARFTIPDGRLAEFEELASKCMAKVRENEAGKGCSQYDWFYNEDKTRCEVRETYRDSAAFFAHAENLGDLLNEIAALGQLEADIYGPASDELRALGAEMRIEFHSHFQSI